MKTKGIAILYGGVIAMVIAASNVSAAPNQAPATPLTEKGNQLLATYTSMLEQLKADITKALPSVDENKKAAFLKAREAEKSALANKNTKQAAFGKINKAAGAVNHAKGKWIGGAEKAIKAAKKMLAEAKTEEERKAVKKELARCEQGKQDGLNALKRWQADYDKIKIEEPRLVKDLKAAKEALAQAQPNTVKKQKELGLDAFLSVDKLDAQLVKYVVISDATPRGLATFAQQGAEEKKLIETLLTDVPLMTQMVVADGAQGGKYDHAMQIYSDIQKASPKAKDGILQRLALAISLEHAVPIAQRNPKVKTDAPQIIDPLKRYFHYEKAYLGGELDPAFKDLSVWDYRMVVMGNEPDDILLWGREMLRNYRPDHISTSDYRWRYMAAVNTDIEYGYKYRKDNNPELQHVQDILRIGGICGRRAIFGRFMLRAFGIPTIKRPQPGHATLAHWTPKGWVVCLGTGWGGGNTRTPYGKDLNFLENTQARMAGKPFLQVKRAQWIGAVMGEPRTLGLYNQNPEFWYCVSLYRQLAIIKEAKAITLAAVGTDIGEANESKVKKAIIAATITDEDKKITVSRDGMITIPATASSKPKNSTRKIKFMPSNLGGMQLHYGRQGGPEKFEYTFDAPKAGTYTLTARVVTPSEKQHLFVASNGATKPVDIKLPFTIGMWDTTPPVKLTLVKGKNVLTFSHQGGKGLTIKEFTITP
jgi:hypothetical protein